MNQPDKMLKQERRKAFWRGFRDGINDTIRNPLYIAAWIAVASYALWKVFYG